MKSAVLTKSWPYIALILSHTIWGVNFVVAKVTLGEIPPMSLAFLRFAIALLFLTPFLLTEKRQNIIKKDLPWLFAVGVLMVTLNIAFFYLGLTRTTVTAASALTLTIPVFSVIAGWWFLKEKIYTANLAGIIFGIAGALVVIGLPLAVFGVAAWNSPSFVGNILIVFASLSWVAGAVISKRMLTKYSTLTVTAIIFLVGVLTFVIPATQEYLQDPAWPARLTYLGIFGLLFIAIASSISAYFLFEWGLSKLGVVRADLFQYLEPLVAVTLGVFILNEGIRFSYIVGAILIGLGAYWSTLVLEAHKHHKAHRT